MTGGGGAEGIVGAGGLNGGTATGGTTGMLGGVTGTACGRSPADGTGAAVLPFFASVALIAFMSSTVSVPLAWRSFRLPSSTL